MNFLDKALKVIENCINTQTYEHVETERFELKDLSTKTDWTELYCTICAFLNTNGGIVVVGIKDKGNEKDKAKRYYKFMGFNLDHEPLVKEISKKFTNKAGTLLDLTQQFPNYEIKNFINGNILVIYVEKLPEEQKFIYFDGKPYKRTLTGDHIIPEIDVNIHEERKQEIINAQEIRIIENTDLSVLNIDTLNQYILRLNRGKQVQTLKANLEMAMPFLQQKYFVREGKPTLLGILVCGNNPEDYIGGRCEIDCYVDSPIIVAQNKQILKDNIILLMEQAINFVYKNIQVGVSRKNSGTTLPEFPDDLLEEIINNAIAHRDYAQKNRFVIITIRSDEFISVRNPGFFQERQRININLENIKIRRIIPQPYSRNPKLLDILKSFDRWEGKGKGLASLTNACLQNTINVPYYLLTLEEITLVIPKGKVFDENMVLWLKSYAGYLYQKMGRHLEEEEKIVLSYFYKSEMLNREERYTVLLTPDNNHFEVIADLEEKGLIYSVHEWRGIYKIYVVDRILIKQDFKPYLKTLFGKEFDFLSDIQKKILEKIYHLETFGSQEEQISANNIGHILYMQENKVISDVKDYENFKRKVRTVFNKLEAKNFIIKKNQTKYNFSINKNFALQKDTLFS